MKNKMNIMETLNEENLGEYPAGFIMNLSGRGIEKATSGGKVYTLHSAKKKLFYLMLLCSISYVCNFIFSECNGGSANIAMRLFVVIHLWIAVIMMIIFAWFSTRTKTPLSQSIVFCVALYSILSLLLFWVQIAQEVMWS